MPHEIIKYALSAITVPIIYFTQQKGLTRKGR